jgi:outer membrane protein assembly factor BamA
VHGDADLASLRASTGPASCGAALVASACAFSNPALAANPFNSDDRTTAAEPKTREPHDKINVVPLVGGTSDVGIGGGGLGNIARVQDGIDPYVWNLEFTAFATFKASDGIQMPYQDTYFKLTVPAFFSPAVRLELRPSYTWESNLGYYGVGNASTDAVPPGADSTYDQYGRRHAAVDVAFSWRIVDHLAAIGAIRYTQNWLEIAPNSKLAQDIAHGSDVVKSLIGPTDPHAVALFRYGLQWDDRDSEVSPHAGQLHRALVYLSPGGQWPFPYRYGNISLESRVFVPVDARDTLALRAVGDLLFGQAPFYELSRYDDTYALGGPLGVRGVPGQRYSGKVKVFGNIEWRRTLTTAQAVGKNLRFELALFADGGRVWSELPAQPELDGSGLGLKYGLGAGLHIASGGTFVLRVLDVAWSPDAHPVGLYCTGGEAF